MRRTKRSSGTPKRFLNADEIQLAVHEVAGLAEAAGVKIALAGGCAMHVHGSQRLTVDVDIVAERPIRGLRRLKPLSFGGYVSETAAGTTVDVMICCTEFEECFDAALDYSVKHRDLPLRVVRPEHLAVMKMIAGRGKDNVDLAWLITSGTLDLKRAKKVVRDLLGHYAAKEFDVFAAEAQWRKDSGLE